MSSCRPDPRRPSWRWLVAGINVVGLCGVATAQGPSDQRLSDGPDSSVTSRRAIALTRALSYDTSLVQRAGDEVVLLVLFKKRHPQSERTAEGAGKAFRQLQNLRIVGTPFRRLVAPFVDIGELEQLVQKEGIDAFFLCDGLEDDLPAIKQVSRRRKVLTLGYSEAQVRAGVSLAVVAEGAKMVILVNWAQSRQEGATFGSDLLRLAKVIR
jgi:YfiR/HmsC-like